MLTASVATACPRHKGEILGRPAINFSATCEDDGCRRVTRWGLEGKQPTHCRDYGPLKSGLVCTVGQTRSNKHDSTAPYSAATGASSRVKTECVF